MNNNPDFFLDSEDDEIDDIITAKNEDYKKPEFFIIQLKLGRNRNKQILRKK